MSRESRILDVGVGSGTVAMALAANFAQVVAVQGVLERCRFIGHRARALQRRSVDIVCADVLRLPLTADQFEESGGAGPRCG